MQTTLYVDKYALVFGLKWRAYDPLASRHSQIADWRSEGFVWQANYKLDADTIVGLAGDDLEDSKRGETRLSGAALIARHPEVRGKTALIIMRVDQDNAVAVGLLKGNVSIDEVIPSGNIAQIRNKFSNEIKSIGEDNALVFENLQFKELVKFRPLAIYFNDARIQHFKSERGAWVMLVLIVLGILAMLGFWFKGRYEAEAKRKASLSAQQAADPKVVYEGLVHQMLKNPTAFAPVQTALPAFRGALNGMGNLLRAGWVFKDAQCKVEAKACTVQWTRTTPSIGSYETFKKDAPSNWKDMEFKADLSQIKFVLPVAIAQSAFSPREKWPTMQELLMQEGSRWQNYAPVGFIGSMRDPVLQGLPSNIQPASVVGTSFAIHASEWEVSDKPLYMAEILEKSPQANMSLESFALVFNGKELNFTAKGKAYVRK